MGRERRKRKEAEHFYRRGVPRHASDVLFPQGHRCAHPSCAPLEEKVEEKKKMPKEVKKKKKREKTRQNSVHRSLLFRHSFFFFAGTSFREAVQPHHDSATLE